MSSHLEARDQLECAIVGGRRGTHRTKFAEGVDVCTPVGSHNYLLELFLRSSRSSFYLRCWGASCTFGKE